MEHPGHVFVNQDLLEIDANIRLVEVDAHLNHVSMVEHVTKDHSRIVVDVQFNIEDYGVNIYQQFQHHVILIHV